MEDCELQVSMPDNEVERRTPAVRHNGSVSRATSTSEGENRVSAHPSLTSSSCTFSCPLPHLLSSSASLSSSLHPPYSPSSFTSLLNPLSSSWIPPFLHTPPFPHPHPNPSAPLFPISLSVCSYPADLCPSCRCWFAHPAPLANMTKRDPQYSNRHTAFKCRMAGSTWVQL